MQLIIDLFGHRWHIISDVSCIPEDAEEEEEFSGRQVQDTSAHHERTGFQPKPYETDGEFQ